MRKFRKSLVVLVGILTALVAAELGLRVFSDAMPQASAWPSAATELKDRQLGASNTYEVIFLGSSITEASVDPDLLSSRSAYNSALPFSTPISNEIWLQGEFDQLDGSVVVLGLPAWPFHGGFDDDPLAGQIRTALDPETSFLDNFALYRNRGVLADWFSRRSRVLTVASGSWTDLGHQTTYYLRSGDSLVGRFPPYGKPQMSDENHSAVEAIAKTVEEGGGTLVLMVEPGRYPGTVRTDEVEQYLGSLQQLAADLDVEYWDTYSLDWDPSLFADEAHFNLEGTILYTNYVSGLLDGLRADL